MFVGRARGTFASLITVQNAIRISVLFATGHHARATDGRARRLIISRAALDGVATLYRIVAGISGPAALIRGCLL